MEISKYMIGSKRGKQFLLSVEKGRHEELASQEKEASLFDFAIK